MNFTGFDDECRVRGLVVGRPMRVDRVEHIMNLSSGMLGINTAVIIRNSQP